ncbi:hypothetical protein PFISCL1PPCAC_12925 [Pristionchus fissidentatus]|uniref:Thioredoxin-like fold domain-containing protein n=1 Tax=Pristionchus fissidentatus TaxID=1538716 RepID=A0AAV5VTJ5_9BILA|nr:hypothetical protein PFISCL1PPCAC_12925 [Pristionchus fissidentatus]
MLLLLLPLLGLDIHDLIYYVGVFTIAAKILPLLPSLKKKLLGAPEELNVKNYEKDVVYLFQLPGSPTAPSMCAYAVKVDSFCRLHKIKCEKRNSMMARGKNGLTPFIELNGVEIYDSQLIIEHLTAHFKLQAYPDDKSAAIGHAVDRMIDKHTAMLNMQAKAGKLKDVVTVSASGKVPAILLPILAFVGSRFMKSKLESKIKASIGPYTEAEYRAMLRKDLVQIQTILDGKQFLVSEKPSAVDCTALAHLGVALFGMPSVRTTFDELIDSEELAALKEYLQRLKDTLFGDQFFDPESRA